MAGSPVNVEDYPDAKSAKTAIIAAVRRDCVAWGGSESDFFEVSENTMVPIGYYKVALIMGQNGDYHWFRQASDLDGAWVHKFATNKATDKDSVVALNAEKSVPAHRRQSLKSFRNV